VAGAEGVAVAMKRLLCNGISYAVFMDFGSQSSYPNFNQFKLSNTPAAPMPPPTHIVTNP